jgi:hypothetical protein
MSDWKHGELVCVEKLSDRQDIAEEKLLSEIPHGRIAIGFLLDDVLIGRPLLILRIISAGRTGLGKIQTSVLRNCPGGT